MVVPLCPEIEGMNVFIEYLVYYRSLKKVPIVWGDRGIRYDPREVQGTSIRVASVAVLNGIRV